MSLVNKRKILRRLKLSKLEFLLIPICLILGFFGGTMLIPLITTIIVIVISVVSITKKFIIIKWYDILMIYGLFFCFFQILSFNYKWWSTIIIIAVLGFYLLYYKFWTVIVNFIQNSKPYTKDVYRIIKKRFTKSFLKVEKKNIKSAFTK